MNRKTIIILISLVVTTAVLSVFLFMKNKTTYVPGEINQPINQGEPIQAHFSCSNGDFIDAKFFNQDPRHVDLMLSDKRNISLPQAISADGARYANTDESFIFWNKGDSAFIEEAGKTTFTNCYVQKNISNATMANPASVNCGQKGGNLVIKNRPDGGQYGLCYFEDNKACEEWALIAGDCPLGGVKTTGFDTDAQMYCAWIGGKTTATKNAICTFLDGSSCPVDQLYVGTCNKKITK
ncbi:MAG: DUF333 domain-containing protein [Candidatus Paceibacterota bacterium]|jgi:putative hemolysin